jgi:hypothetical protein
LFDSWLLITQDFFPYLSIRLLLNSCVTHVIAAIQTTMNVTIYRSGQPFKNKLVLLHRKYDKTLLNYLAFQSFDFERT